VPLGRDRTSNRRRWDGVVARRGRGLEVRVFETQLPGIGDRFTVEFEDGGQPVVVIQNEGGRVVYWRPTSEAEKERLFEATDREGRTLAEVFDGSYFEPVAETVSNPDAGFVIEADDVLVVVGSEEAHAALERMLTA
jgi:K+/H+ antiporter YhaU regulatory subunit KhtT